MSLWNQSSKCKARHRRIYIHGDKKLHQQTIIRGFHGIFFPAKYFCIQYIILHCTMPSKRTIFVSRMMPQAASPHRSYSDKEAALPEVPRSLSQSRKRLSFLWLCGSPPGCAQVQCGSVSQHAACTRYGCGSKCATPLGRSHRSEQGKHPDT